MDVTFVSQLGPPLFARTADKCWKVAWRALPLSPSLPLGGSQLENQDLCASNWCNWSLTISSYIMRASFCSPSLPSSSGGSAPRDKLAIQLQTEAKKAVPQPFPLPLSLFPPTYKNRMEILLSPLVSDVLIEELFIVSSSWALILLTSSLCSLMTSL